MSPQFYIGINASVMGYGEIYLHRQNETLLTRTKNFGRTFMKLPPFPPFIVSMISDYEVTVKKQVHVYDATVEATNLERQMHINFTPRHCWQKKLCLVTRKTRST